MKKVLKSIWWRVLIVHVAMISLWCGGINEAGIMLFLVFGISFFSWKIGRGDRFFKEPIIKKISNQRKTSSLVTFRG